MQEQQPQIIDDLFRQDERRRAAAKPRTTDDCPRPIKQEQQPQTTDDVLRPIKKAEQPHTTDDLLRLDERRVHVEDH